MSVEFNAREFCLIFDTYLRRCNTYCYLPLYSDLTISDHTISLYLSGTVLWWKKPDVVLSSTGDGVILCELRYPERNSHPFILASTGFVPMRGVVIVSG